MITVVGLSHKSAPIDVRERIAIAGAELPALLGELRGLPPVGEVIVLSTCNRVEIYAAPPRAARADAERAALEEISGSVATALSNRGGRDVSPHLRRLVGLDALRHLFRVAASLDSLVVGEPQILGQLKEAIDIARTSGTVGPTLSKAMSRALHVGKRVRTETAIGAGQVSVSSIAVDLAAQIFGDLAGKTALLVGAGEMAEAAAKLLAKAGARLLVVNRSPERARTLATEVGGQPRPWGELNWCLIESDIVVSSTASPVPVITVDTMKTARKARRGRSIFLIDIAVPRDVDPKVGALENVFLYDIDDLSRIVAESLEGRAAEAHKAERMVEAEVEHFEAWSLERALTPVIIGLRARTRAVLAAELERSLSGKLKHLGEEDREALKKLVDAATNKLCHHPSTRLKSMTQDPRCGEYVEAMRDLFDLPELPDDEDSLGASERDHAIAGDDHPPRREPKQS